MFLVNSWSLDLPSSFFLFILGGWEEIGLLLVLAEFVLFLFEGISFYVELSFYIYLWGGMGPVTVSLRWLLVGLL